MKREIKFRGKRLINGEWAYGSLLIQGSGRMCIYDATQCMREVQPDTIGQFTGLTDANGKEIYENDIVRVSISKDSIGVVKYSTDQASFIVQMKNSMQWFHLWNGYKVIGNIHDNMDLLKGGSDGQTTE